MAVVLAIDAGTTSVRTVAVNERGQPTAIAAREVHAVLPAARLGRARPRRDLAATLATLAEVVDAIGGEPVAGIGITNQRETVVVWDRATGAPRHRALVWQDRRTAARCDELRAAGHEPSVRSRTGLVLDPYFSATKLEWLLQEGGVVADPALAFGTVDTWILWNLTGGVHGACTRPSRRTRAARCSSTSTRSTGRRSCSTCSACRARASVTCSRAAAASA